MQQETVWLHKNTRCSWKIFLCEYRILATHKCNLKFCTLNIGLCVEGGEEEGGRDGYYSDSKK